MQLCFDVVVLQPNWALTMFWLLNLSLNEDLVWQTPPWYIINSCRLQMLDFLVRLCCFFALYPKYLWTMSLYLPLCADVGSFERCFLSNERNLNECLSYLFFTISFLLYCLLILLQLIPEQPIMATRGRKRTIKNLKSTDEKHTHKLNKSTLGTTLLVQEKRRSVTVTRNLHDPTTFTS